MFEEITKEFIRTHKFVATFSTFKPTSQSFKLLPRGKNLPPSPNELQGELRTKFSEIMATTFNSDYVQVENKCYISKASMRKYLNGSRDITMFAVARLCVGAHLPLEKASELFKLCGHILSPKDFLLDAIVCDTINCGENIEDFYETTKQYGLDSLWKKFDKISLN